MGALRRHAWAWLIVGLTMYALLYAGISYLKLEARPSPGLQAFVAKHFDAVCPDYLISSPRDAHAVYSCAWSVRESAMMAALFLPFPAAILLGSLFVVLTHLGLGALVIRTSSPLCATVRKGLEVVKLEPELLSLPVAASVAVSALLGFVFWRAFSDPRAAQINSDSVSALAWTVILAPPVLAGYFAVAFLLLLTNAALIHAYLAHAEGRPTGFWSSALAALRIAPAVAVLAVSVFGVLLGVAAATYGVRRRVSFGAGEAARFAAFFLESGLLIGAQLVIAAMLSEGLGLRDALRRVSGVVKPAGREILTAAFGMATMRHDACVAAMAGPMLTGWFCLPMYVDSMALGLAVSLAAGILAGSLYYSFLGALEGVFAAGIWVYATRGKVLRGLERGEVSAFVDGLAAAAR